MSMYEEVSKQLAGKTGIPEEQEKELIRRVAIIEESGGVCGELPKSDWALTAVIGVLFGIVPLILVIAGVL